MGLIFQPIRALLNLMRNEPRSLKTYCAYDRIVDLCPSEEKRYELISVFSDLIEEHVMMANDYEIPHKCEFEVARPEDPRSLRAPSECGEPAPYRIFWIGNEELWACEHHFELVMSDPTEKTP